MRDLPRDIAGRVGQEDDDHLACVVGSARKNKGSCQGGSAREIPARIPHCVRATKVVSKASSLVTVMISSMSSLQDVRTNPAPIP